MRVEVHIERLVVDGADPGAGALAGHREHAFREALAAELSALLKDTGSWAPYEVSTAAVPLASRPNAAGAAGYGRAVARSVHAALTPAGVRAGRRPS